ncbi:hypothetical protein BDN72DRAFT_881652 [Pluteus cervinus]|uniref:Uncharacterized protein n=1 Tax=Pluteus cervinus TaxID=181527 RepID=A0ACD3AF88_9AGAR|nr:hypothetical protein BDN72DRAFT_881652 [Pluteus cervinus]
MSILPVELVEHILQFVYGHYRSPKKPFDLFRCALVCYTWRIISQPLIFSEITLGSWDERKKMFEENNHLRRYVHLVWVRRNGHLSNIQETLKLFPNLHELYMVQPPTTRLLGGADIQMTLRNLTSIGLSACRCGFPVPYFYHCAALRELKMNRCLFDFQYAQLSSHTPKPRLHSLHIAADRFSQMRILEWMLSPQGAFDLTELTTFMSSDLTGQRDQRGAFTWVQEIVQLCAPTLRELMISPPISQTTSTPDHHLLHPSTLSNLRLITISIRQNTVTHNKMNYVPWMTAFFSQLPTDNCLEEIRIPCEFAGPGTTPWVFPPIEYDMGSYGWNALDTVLSSSYHKLKRVAFSIYDRPTRSETLGPLLRDSLPRLNKRGILEIVTSETHGYIAKEDCWWCYVG